MLPGSEIFTCGATRIVPTTIMVRGDWMKACGYLPVTTMFYVIAETPMRPNGFGRSFIVRRADGREWTVMECRTLSPRAADPEPAPAPEPKAEEKVLRDWTDKPLDPFYGLPKILQGNTVVLRDGRRGEVFKIGRKYPHVRFYDTNKRTPIKPADIAKLIERW